MPVFSRTPSRLKKLERAIALPQGGAIVSKAYDLMERFERDARSCGCDPHAESFQFTARRALTLHKFRLGALTRAEVIDELRTIRRQRQGVVATMPSRTQRILDAHESAQRFDEGEQA